MELENMPVKNHDFLPNRASICKKSHDSVDRDRSEKNHCLKFLRFSLNQLETSSKMVTHFLIASNSVNLSFVSRNLVPGAHNYSSDSL